jgi:hypothetical protein
MVIMLSKQVASSGSYLLLWSRTSWGVDQGDQIGRIFAHWGDCLLWPLLWKVGQIFLGECFYGQKWCIHFDGKWVGRFFLNSSGHPGDDVQSDWKRGGGGILDKQVISFEIWRIHYFGIKTWGTALTYIQLKLCILSVTKRF